MQLSILVASLEVGLVLVVSQPGLSTSFDPSHAAVG